MQVEFTTLGALPDEFYEMVKREFVPYSVGMCRIHENDASTFTALGTGVLVKKKGCVGILTARHCLHACSPEVSVGYYGRDSLILLLGRGRDLTLPPAAFREHLLTNPVCEEYGPHLTFLEIVSPGARSTILAIGSAWPLDQDYKLILQEFGGLGTMLAFVGYPETAFRTTIKENNIDHHAEHLTIAGTIEKDGTQEIGGWDYVDGTCRYDTSPDLPESFRGISGGPIWALQVRKNDFGVQRSALVGICFYQTDVTENSRKLRGHFVNSIYELAWRQFRPSC